MENNKCVNCGKIISVSNKYFRKCEECIKKPKRKHLSNIDILSKYQKSRTLIKSEVEKLVKLVNRELLNLSDIKEKSILNGDNLNLLDLKLSKLIIFKTKLLGAWAESLIEDKPEEFDITKLLKLKNTK